MTMRSSRTDSSPYKQLFEKAPLAMFIVGRDGGIREVNAMACSLTGYSRVKLLSLRFDELFAREHTPSGPPPHTASGDKSIVQREGLLQRKDGRVLNVEISGRALPGGDLHAIVRDISRYGSLERRLRLAQLCMDHAEVGIIILDSAGRILNANALAHTWLHAESSDIAGEMVFRVDPHLTATRWTGLCDQLRAMGTTTITMGSGHDDREGLSLVVRASHLQLDETDYFLLLARNNAQEKRTEEALRESEALLRSFHQNTLMGLYRSTPDGKILMANDALLRMLGYASFDDLAKRDLKREGYETPSDRKEFLRTMEEKGQIVGYEARWQRHDGTTIWIREGARAVRDEHGTIIYFDGTVEDITERKHAELRLRASLEEKETLLKEVHHRVKNNLQIISSLLNLQASEIADQTLFEMFKESQNRIRSLALVHEKLYQAQNLAQVSFLDYLQSVTMQLARSYEREGLSWRVEGDAIHLSVDQAIPCGLIVNELISNAMKHAFVGREEGTLLVGLKQLADGRVELRVQDNGVGFPVGRNFREAKSMGMVLIMSLVEQIDAAISLDRTDGTAFIVQFRPHP